MAFCGTHIYERVRTQLACVSCMRYACSARAVINVNQRSLNPASLAAPVPQVAVPSGMRQQPGPATASNASCPITNVAPALKYKQLQPETAPVGTCRQQAPV